MLDSRKIRTMSRLSIFEESPLGKKSLRICRFFKNDYLRWELLKTVAGITVGYIIFIGLMAMYNLEFLIKNATSLDYKSLFSRFLGYYLILLVIYVAGTFFLANYRYSRYNKNFKKYDRKLKELGKLYEEEGPSEKRTRTEDEA